MQKPKFLTKTSRHLLRTKTGKSLRRYMKSLGFTKVPGAYEPMESPKQSFVPENPNLIKPIHKAIVKGSYR